LVAKGKEGESELYRGKSVPKKTANITKEKIEFVAELIAMDMLTPIRCTLTVGEGGPCGCVGVCAGV
jgi:hypothetical protein